MKVVAISDSHCGHYELKMPAGDMLIHAGDFTGMGTRSEILSFCEWLANQPYEHKIVVAGNHELDMELHPHEYIQMFHDAGAVYLMDQTVKISGFTIHGSPWCNPYGEWAFMRDQSHQKAAYELIPKEVDILVTHNPPYGILDKNGRGLSCGSSALLDAILARDIKHHVFGHIHASSGKDKMGTMNFYNVAVMDENYDIAKLPTEFEVEHER